MGPGSLRCAFGSLEVVVDGRRIEVPSGRQRPLLAILALHAPDAVSTDELIELLWPEEQPANAAGALQVLVSRLRAKLGSGAAGGGRRIVTRRRLRTRRRSRSDRRAAPRPHRRIGARSPRGGGSREGHRALCRRAVARARSAARGLPAGTVRAGRDRASRGDATRGDRGAHRVRTRARSLGGGSRRSGRWSNGTPCASGCAAH